MARMTCLALTEDNFCCAEDSLDALAAERRNGLTF